MKSFKTTALAASAAFALAAAPAVAQETTPQGQTTSPAKICKAESKKKTN